MADLIDRIGAALDAIPTPRRPYADLDDGVPSVSEVVGVFDPADKARRMAHAAAIVTAKHAVYRTGWRGTDPELSVRRLGRKFATEWQLKADAGTRAHEQIARFLTLSETPDDLGAIERGHFDAALWFITDTGADPVLVEATIETSTPGTEYRGTLDASDYGDGEEYPIVTIRQDDGEEVAVHGFHTVLKRELAKLAPKVGDQIGVKYVGIPAGKSYELYRVILERGDGAAAAEPDWATMAQQADREAALTDDDPF